ncbi:MAG: type I-E CRISPR-associated protein Cas5/CasD [Gemmatimonadetes bacterium]|nr:type I-E CRISPR-associated protein Cas5/CasD [Gemmatimonadota bacterium]
MEWTLLLRLAGPQQSWGTQSRFTVRETGREPSKSGVIGLLCAALGKPRAEHPGDPWPPLSDLARLRMGVRVDSEGILMRDYHTAGGGPWPGLKNYGVSKADGSGRDTVVSERFFLADADFLIGLESSDLSLLRRLDAALAAPHWQLFLGRKSFVPSVPVRLPDQPPLGPGLRRLPLEEALSTYPYRPAMDYGGQVSDRLRLVIDAAPGQITNDVRNDVPLSFASRDFTLRYVRTDWIATPKEAN